MSWKYLQEYFLGLVFENRTYVLFRTNKRYQKVKKVKNRHLKSQNGIFDVITIKNISMKKVFLFSLLFLAAFQGFSQAEYKAENEGWLVKVEEAFAQSQATGKPILANFTGSDWCGWCKRLTAAVFTQDEFKTWAADNVILLELDFPRRKQIPAEIRSQNQQLQQAFGVSGFPTVWVFRLEQDKEKPQMMIDGLGKTGYRPSAKEFIADIDAMIARSEKAKAAKGETNGE